MESWLQKPYFLSVTVHVSFCLRVAQQQLSARKSLCDADKEAGYVHAHSEVYVIIQKLRLGHSKIICQTVYGFYSVVAYYCLRNVRCWMCGWNYADQFPILLRHRSYKVF